MTGIAPVQPGVDPERYAVIDPETGAIAPGRAPSLTHRDYVSLYRWMRFLRAIDERMIVLQRQGRISFYGAATGQEAAVIGTGYVLAPGDWILPALREGGVALLRGYPFSAYVDQCFGNATDLEKGRQMPCHYGHRDVNYVTLSSNIATQLTQAVGVALAQKTTRSGGVAVGYIGDGGTSEADFHVALEFAARLHAPVVFVCQNNQWAISTGVGQQTRARSIAHKAHGYGLPGFAVDGNDVLACAEVMRHAVERARRGEGPSLIEALTYRIGAHSTSDDPTRYRDEAITEQWKQRDPIARFRRTLDHLGLWDDARDAALEAEHDARIRAEIQRAEAVGPPELETLFEDVYAEPTPLLREQQAALRRHLALS